MTCVRGHTCRTNRAGPLPDHPDSARGRAATRPRSYRPPSPGARPRTVSRAVNASHELIEDACQNAWTSLLRHQPERAHVFSWLRVVAIHEAYRLSRTERRPIISTNSTPRTAGTPRSRTPARSTTRLEARWALQVLAELPDHQRQDLSLLVAGFSYREIAEMTSGRTYTNVNKHVGKARACVRRSHGLCAPE